MPAHVLAAHKTGCAWHDDCHHQGAPTWAAAVMLVALPHPAHHGPLSFCTWFTQGCAGRSICRRAAPGHEPGCASSSWETRAQVQLQAAHHRPGIGMVPAAKPSCTAWLVAALAATCAARSSKSWSQSCASQPATTHVEIPDKLNFQAGAHLAGLRVRPQSFIVAAGAQILLRGAALCTR